MRNSTEGPIPFSPSLPDITKRQPTKAYSGGSYLLFLVEDVAPLGGGDFLKYAWVMAVIDKRAGTPLCFVSLENSPFVSNMLCVFEGDGSHSTYGQLSGDDLKSEFTAKAFDLVRSRFDLGEIEELGAKVQNRPWWKLW